MKKYWIKTPRWLPLLQSRHLTWKADANGEQAVYLTFDDGPHPTATPFVLDELAKWNAKATFFCVGKNVTAHPEIYQRIIDEQHAVGNHTQNHVNGWKTKTEEYIGNIAAASETIDSRLFRPPYGRITSVQASMLVKANPPYKIIMWDVLSADFDTTITPEKCLQNVLENSQPGSIIVFHDSTKAWDRMRYALPRVLDHFSKNGWKCKALTTVLTLLYGTPDPC